MAGLEITLACRDYDHTRGLRDGTVAAFQSAKARAYDRLKEALYPLPWINLDFEYAKQAMGGEVYAYGIKRNVTTLEAATLFSYEQGLTRRKLEVSELFAPETFELLENDSAE